MGITRTSVPFLSSPSPPPPLLPTHSYPRSLPSSQKLTCARTHTAQVKIMVQKQDAVFERLTNFAVWVQECTKYCRMVEFEAHESRDAARRTLVALWVRADDECERYSLAAPSESSHIFQLH